MTLVYSRDLGEERATHARVVGIGSYANLALSGVEPPDLPSAVAGATQFAIWLIQNADCISPKLGTVDLFLSPPGERPGRFEIPTGINLTNGAMDPRTDSSVANATGPEIDASKQDWLARIGQNEHSALIYITGHGVSTAKRTMVFLADVNNNPPYRWNPHIDLQVESSRMRRHPSLGTSVVFVDACQEALSAAQLDEADRQDMIQDSVSFFDPTLSARDRTNLYMLAPTPVGNKAWDDETKIGGRFTQALIEALSGAASCDYNGMGQWGVRVSDLHDRLRYLYSLRPMWRDKSFEPVPLTLPNRDEPIVVFSQPPKVPICLSIQPDVARHMLTEISFADLLNSTEIQNFPIAGNNANGISVASDGILLVTWPQASARQHALTISIDQAADRAHELGNVDRVTHLNISEMRVMPAIHHDVS